MTAKEFGKWAIWLPLLPAAWGIWWLWWKLPKRQMRSITLGDPKARADIEDNFRRTIGQALGAIAVLIGAGFAVVQFLDQRDTAQKQIAVSQQQVQAFHDLLISNQIPRAKQ